MDTRRTVPTCAPRGAAPITTRFGRRHIIRLPGRRGARSWREALDVDHVELDLLEQGQRSLELLLRLTRIANDDIGRDGEIGDDVAGVGDDRTVLVDCIAAAHLLEDSVVAGLEREV